MPISNVPTLPPNIAIVDPETGYPSTQFARWWQDSVQNAVNSLVAGANAAAAAAAAQAAATTANAAAASATTAAATAQAAGTAATAAAAANAREAAIVNSSITPASVLSATPTTITVAAHTRQYADGTSVAVSGGIVAATAVADVDYISYVQLSRAGGAVTYVASTVAPVQSGDTHVIGAVTIPASGSAAGGTGPKPPGYVIP